MAKTKGKTKELETSDQDLSIEDRLSDNALKVFKRRYVRKGADGQPKETVEGVFRRVASHVAAVEDEAGGDAKEGEAIFFDLMTTLRFLPNSPTFTGAGTPLAQLAACFVLPISDDMGRAGDGIFETLRDMALIQQTGGGTGFSFSRLRPRGAIVHSSGGEATGPVGFMQVYDTASEIVSQGGCLAPDSLIFTQQGLLRLDELMDVNQPGWQPHDIAVATDGGQRRSPRGYNHGVSPVLRVRTDSGLTLTGTPDHRVKVMTDDGPSWRRLDDLQSDDRILLKLGQHRGQQQSLHKPEMSHWNQVQPTLPPVLNEDLAFFLGYLAGDGFVARGDDDYRVGVSVAHTSYLMREMPALMGRLFGVNVQTQVEPGGGSTTFIVQNRAVKDFLMLNDLTKSDSHTVQTPRLVRMSRPEVVGAYLRGLFEADGRLSHGYPALLTTSEHLAEEVAVLLIGLGCPVSLRSLTPGAGHWGDESLFEIRIRSHVGLEAWREYIGCDPRSRFATSYAWEPDLTREYSYPLPCPSFWIEPVLEEITLPQIDRRGRGLGRKFRSTEPKLRRRLLRYLRRDRRLTRSGYKLLAQTYSVFDRYASPINDLWFVAVEAVEPAGKMLTLDLEVDGNYTYLAKGFVTHNSRRGANMGVLRADHPDIREFIRCKSEEGEISNFNISVGVTDDFMRAVEEDEAIDLINPQDGEVWDTVDAREIFDEVIEGAHRNGEPGMLFLDATNRGNPTPHLGEYEATNPCVTGDTLIYTARGIYRADELAALDTPFPVVVDGRFGVDTLQEASSVFPTGVKDVYRVRTKEGYELRLTANHRVRTDRGWVEVQHLRPDDRIHILNRTGAFGEKGLTELGLVLGWLVGDGTVNRLRAVLSFFGPEKVELAPLFADAVTSLVDEEKVNNRHYPVSPIEIPERDEVRVQSERLRGLVVEQGLGQDKLQVPPSVWRGTKEMQASFLRALFTADGTVLDGGDKGCSVRLTSVSYELLQDVQRLLLNFGVASKIYQERRSAGKRTLPDGKGGYAEYFCQAYHELVVSKDNLVRFSDRIGFLTERKQSALGAYLERMRRGPYRERFTAQLESVEFAGRERVYDLAQPTTHSFVANGAVVHNCGEQPLLPYENCCLGSINLAQHVREAGSKGQEAGGRRQEARVDWEKLAETVERSVRFLDDVIDANGYVPAVPQLEEAAKRTRRIGLGITGLGDVLYQLRVRYGSEEGQELAAQVMEFIRYHAMQASIELAKERGPFPAIKGSIYDREDRQWTPPEPLEPFMRLEQWGRPRLDWDTIAEGIEAHGIRNATQTVVAPTGTRSTVAGCEGYGCEPVFALAYVRHMNDNGTDVELRYASPLFQQALEKAGLDEETRQRIIEQVAANGSCQDVEEVPEPIRQVFVVAQDIPAEEHVRMQAALQAFVDASISKCVTGDTLLFTERGILPIGDLRQNDPPDTFRTLNDPLRVADWGGPMAAQEFYFGGEQETICLTTGLGLRLEATPNHRVRVLEEGGDIVWRRMDELRDGDYLVVPYDYPEALGRRYEFSQVYGTTYQAAERTVAKTFSLPYKMTRDLSRLLGYLTADGYIGENWVQLSQSDDQVVEDAKEIFRRLFDAEAKHTLDERREHLNVLQVNGRDLVRFFRDYLGMEGLAPEKHIPRCITASGPWMARDYVRGLTLDGYVSSQGRVVPLTTTSEQLVRETQALLLALGIPTRLSMKEIDYEYKDGREGSISYEITVLPEFRERFLEAIGFAEERKNRKAWDNLPPPRQRRGGHIPGVTDMCITLMEAQLPHVRSRRAETYLRSTMGSLRRRDRKSLAIDRIRYILDLCADQADTDEYRRLTRVTERKVVYTPVTSLSRGRAAVYDLHVPETNSFISNGLVSHNTINFPANAKPDDVAHAFKLAWKLGCKGLTVYVTGSREKEVLETEETRKKERNAAVRAMSTKVRPRPHTLEGKTYRLKTPLGTAYTTVNINGEGEPFEVFLNVGKAGSDTAAVAEAIGRLISLVLRIPSPLSATRRLKQVIRHLKGIGGGRSLGFGSDRVRSLPDGVAQVLAEHLGLAESPDKVGTSEQLPLFPEGDLCPECGQATLVFEEGCNHCYTCGYSEC